MHLLLLLVPLLLIHPLPHVMLVVSALTVPPLVWSALAGLIPLAAALITFGLMNAWKKGWAWLGNQPPAVQQAVVGFIAAALNAIPAAFPNLPLPKTVDGVNAQAVSTFVTYVLAYVLHLAKQFSDTSKTVASIASTTQATLNRVTPAQGVAAQPMTFPPRSAK